MYNAYDTFEWMAGSGRKLSLSITLEHAKMCSHPGQCDADVEWLIERVVGSQVDQWDPDTLKAELDEYGAWEDSGLSDHETNVQRMVWIACCDVAENPSDYFID